MTTPQHPEDRLRAALSDRAAAARTSSDALDGVFTKVSRHRRNARLATAGAGTTLAILAGVLVVSTSATPGRDRVVPASASPSTDAVPEPTASVSPSVTPSLSTSRVPVAYAKDRAMVALRDGRIVEVSTTTGDVVRVIAKADGDTKWSASSVHWSVDRESLVVVRGCAVTRVELDSGARRDLGNGSGAVISPDGRYVASVDCEEGGRVNVLDLRTGKAKTFRRPVRSTPTDSSMQDMDVLSAIGDLEWYDAQRLIVARQYEGAQNALLLDVVRDDELADGEDMRISADNIGRGTGMLAWTNSEYRDQAPVKVWTRPDGGRTTMLFERERVGTVAYDARGALLFVDGKGLWRWDAGGPTLLVENAVLVSG